jgi:hypothetical protein
MYFVRIANREVTNCGIANFFSNQAGCPTNADGKAKLMPSSRPLHLWEETPFAPFALPEETSLNCPPPSLVLNKLVLF